jgi:hypothetical protein
MGPTTLVKDEPATTPATPPPADGPPPHSPYRVRLVFSALLLVLLLAALEQMAVATALPEIVGELRGVDRMSWPAPPWPDSPGPWTSSSRSARSRESARAAS